MTNARDMAVKTLYEIFYNGAYSNLAIKNSLRRYELNKKDTALFTNLVYGVVSRHYTLEYVISQYSSVKLKKISKYIKIILELGIYQLMFADRIPQNSAVDESVKLAKKYGRKGTDKFVNAILRSFCRDGCDVSYPEDETANFAVIYSCSEDMARLWIDDFGYERAKSIMNSLNCPAPLLLRANTLKVSTQELVTMLKEYGYSTDITDTGLVSVSGFDIGESELYQNGYFSVQDTGAYNAALSLAPEMGETIIDMCAAPGGKTTHIAEIMQNTGMIFAFDIYEHKIKLIQEACKRLGIDSVKAQVSDSTIYNSDLNEVADRVLCDVPCSGWGIIRRKPDIKLGGLDYETLLPIQKAILENGAKYVKHGGVIVYSTCTLNRRENEDITDKFISENKDFEKVYEKTFYPDTDVSDGFYICKMIKK